jgi:hypothetical protein
LITSGFRDTVSQNISLASDYYFIAAYIAYTDYPNDPVNVTVKITGQLCPTGTVWLNDQCVVARIEPTNDTFNSTNQQIYYFYHIDPLTDKYVKNFTFNLNVANGTYKIYKSYGSTPVVNDTDIAQNSLINPQAGDLYVLYDLTTTDIGSHYHILAPTSESCPNSTLVGPNCDTKLTNISSSIQSPAPLNIYTLTNGSWNYYKYQVYSPDSGTVLWVSAAPSTNGNSLSDFVLYVKRDALPFVNDTDSIMNCNLLGQNCDFAHTVVLNNTVLNYTFYIGIYAIKTTSYGIWWSSICPPKCINDDESGDCTWTGGSVGQCVCADGYTGLDCTLSTGILPTQYIVLIIIASLVVLSALIGFFAWAYMQRKREGYSSLT